MARTTGKWRDRMKNNADVTRIVTYNCRKMAICCFLLLCIKVSWRHLANLKQMLRICALPALRSIRAIAGNDTTRAAKSQGFYSNSLAIAVDNVSRNITIIFKQIASVRYACCVGF